MNHINIMSHTYRPIRMTRQWLEDRGADVQAVGVVDQVDGEVARALGLVI